MRRKIAKTRQSWAGQQAPQPHLLLRLLRPNQLALDLSLSSTSSVYMCS